MNNLKVQKRHHYIGLTVIVLLTIISIVAPLAIAYMNTKCAKAGESCSTSKGCCPEAPICNPDTTTCSEKSSDKYILNPGVCNFLTDQMTSGLTGGVSYADADKLVEYSGLKCDTDDDCDGFVTTSEGFAYKCVTPITYLKASEAPPFSDHIDYKTYIHK
jgi:hypothetical protein